MNKMKFMVLFMSIAMIFGSCGSMNNTGKGAAIGGVLQEIPKHPSSFRKCRRGLPLPQEIP